MGKKSIHSQELLEFRNSNEPDLMFTRFPWCVAPILIVLTLAYLLGEGIWWLIKLVMGLW